MIIEFYGLPASGKTAIAQKVAEENLVTIIAVTGKFEIILRNSIFFFRHPKFYITTLWYILRYADIFRLQVFWTFLLRTAKYQKASSAGNVILDEGYWQHILSLFATEQPRRRIEAYTKLFPNIQSLIIIEASSEKQREFRKKRGRFTREKFKKENVERWEDAIKVHHKYIKEIAARTLPVYVIKNNGEVEVAVQACMEKIKKLKP